MAIVETKDEKTGRKVYKYEQPDWNVLYEKCAKLLDSFGKYVKANDPNLSIKEFTVDRTLLAELIVRIDKRRDYFIIFHDDTEMNEIKEAALVAYWILKFRPFTTKNIRYAKINEAFAVFAIYSTIKETTSRSNTPFGISTDFNKKIMYGFKYWDISKEALMLVSEALCEGAHIGKKKKNGRNN